MVTNFFFLEVFNFLACTREQEVDSWDEVKGEPRLLPTGPSRSPIGGLGEVSHVWHHSSRSLLCPGVLRQDHWEEKVNKAFSPQRDTQILL